jgi:hypothetical protein
LHSSKLHAARQPPFAAGFTERQATMQFLERVLDMHNACAILAVACQHDHTHLMACASSRIITYLAKPVYGQEGVIDAIYNLDAHALEQLLRTSKTIISVCSPDPSRARPMWHATALQGYAVRARLCGWRSPSQFRTIVTGSLIAIMGKQYW